MAETGTPRENPQKQGGGEGASCPASNPGPSGCEEKS